METKSLIGGIIAGAIGLIVLFAIVISIACAINGVTFMEQVVAWFAPSFELVKKAVTETPIV